MQTITITELKQNPAEAVRKVMTSGEPAQLTAYRRPLGVMLSPERSHPHAWVNGRLINSLFALTALSAEEAATWAEEIHEGRSGEFTRSFDWGDE